MVSHRTVILNCAWANPALIPSPKREARRSGLKGCESYARSRGRALASGSLRSISRSGFGFLLPSKKLLGLTDTEADCLAARPAGPGDGHRQAAKRPHSEGTSRLMHTSIGGFDVSRFCAENR